MNTGVYISGIGHIGLILWVLFGGLFSLRPPAPLEVSEVSIITGEEFAALSAPASAPRAEVEAPLPRAPQAEVTPVAPPAPDVAPSLPEAPAAPPAPPPPPDTAPDPSAIAPPEAEVSEEAPIPPLPPSEDDGSAIVAESAPPRPAPRVAPEAAAPPAPDALVSPTIAEATRPEPEAEAPEPARDENTAPEEATTRIVTEAEEREEAGELMMASIRPRARPRPPARPAATPPQPPAAADPLADAVASAVAEAVAGGAATTSGAGSARAGPPMTQGEKDALRIAVQRCWVVDPGSAASRITLTVGMSLTEEGRVEGGSLKLLSSTDGEAAAVRTAFDAARRAILRCQQSGYDLPAEKYAQWRNVEITFDPSKMRR